MNFDETLRVLQQAAGDPAKLGLASIDLLLSGHSERERAKLREALEAAAIPHWFDERILAALLELPIEEGAEFTVRFRQLPVVEPFPARGPVACNVHEKSRFALRERVRNDAPERFHALSARARSCFPGEEAHLRIEALYHRFATEPDAAVWECGDLYEEWTGAGRHEALLALGVALEELISADLAAGSPCGVVFYCLASIRYHYQPREVTAHQATEALAEFARAEDLWRLANTQELLGNVEFDRGNLESALDWYRRSRETRQQLVAEAPADAGRLRNLSVSYDKVGDVQSAQGDLAGALKSYRDSLAIREKLAGQDPGNAQWQRDLSVSYNKVGDVQSAQGDLAGALKSYRDSLAIREKLAGQDPSNAEWQRDLSVSYDKVGDVQSAQGDLAGALKSYRDSLAIREKLAGQDPSNAQWQRDLSVSYMKVGDVQSAQGDLVGALKSYRDSLAIAEKLAGQDPGNAQWQRDLAFSCWRTGTTLVKAEPKSQSEARAMVGKGRDILQQLKERIGLTALQQEWLDAIEADLGTKQEEER